jgi:putative Mg2+ transporter-C (MgtC) family protein
MPISTAAVDPAHQAFWLHIGTAVVCGGLIGFERQYRGKVAGVRTSILICVGTFIFVALGVSMAPGGGDPTRVLGQVVTGVGFLGAGVILTQEGRILGVTTAAVIWALAAIGCLVGAGLLSTAFVVTLVVLAILLGVEGVENFLERVHGRRVSRELEGINLE